MCMHACMAAGCEVACVRLCVCGGGRGFFCITWLHGSGQQRCMQAFDRHCEGERHTVMVCALISSGLAHEGMCASKRLNHDVACGLCGPHCGETRMESDCYDAALI